MRTVKLHGIGRNSHTDEMLIAYLPEQRMVYQGDPLILPLRGGLVPPASMLTREFAERLRALGLTVDAILGAHGRVATMRELEVALAGGDMRDEPATPRAADSR